MKKKYILYYALARIPDPDCGHHIAEFDTIEDAVRAYDKAMVEDKHILKLVTWKTDISDITEEQEKLKKGSLKPAETKES